ncbi:MAG: hypothetical protein SGARI_004753, partial [Bacillariaceae sp.]
MMMMMMMKAAVVFLLHLTAVSLVSAFVTVVPSNTGLSSSSLYAVTPATPATPVDQVVVLPDAAAVGDKIRSIVEDAAKEAIAEKGHFYLAIPGGSILKMLVGSGIRKEWCSKTTIAYANHKCVDMGDEDLAPHAKAMKLFMSEWEGCNPIVLDGTNNGPQEAAAYEAKLKALDNLPLNSNGLPVFDLALIGVGDDGHIGSLYPNREEVLETEKWVLSVAMKEPPSITLSLPVMAGATQVVVAACGVSDKYPQGKSAGMHRAVAAEDESLQSFPA